MREDIIMTDQKYNPFLQIVKAFVGIGKQEEYFILRKQKTGSKLLTALIVAVLMTLLVIGVTGVQVVNNEDLNRLVRAIPAFSLANGELHMEGKVRECYDGQFIMIDTDVEYFSDEVGGSSDSDAVSVKDILREASEKEHIIQAIFLSRKNMVVVSNNPSQNGSVNWKDIPINFSNESIVNGYQSFLTKIFVIAALFYLPWRYMLLFFVPLMFAVIGLIIEAVIKSDQQFADIYWMTFYCNIVLVILKCATSYIVKIPGIVWLALYIAFMIILLNYAKNHMRYPQVAGSSVNPYNGIQNNQATPTWGPTASSNFNDDEEFNRFMSQGEDKDKDNL